MTAVPLQVETSSAAKKPPRGAYPTLALLLLAVSIFVLGSAFAAPLLFHNPTVVSAFDRYNAWFGALVGFVALIFATAAQFSFARFQDKQKEADLTLSVAVALKWEIQMNLLAIGYGDSAMEALEKTLPRVEPEGNYQTSMPSFLTVEMVNANYHPFQTEVFHRNAGNLAHLSDKILADVFLFYSGIRSFEFVRTKLTSNRAPQDRVPNNLLGGLRLTAFALRQCGNSAVDNINLLLATNGRRIIDFARGAPSS
jgi:hypothetical protein